MANKKASLKSVRRTERQTARNRSIISRLRTQLKKVFSLKEKGAGGVCEAARVYISYLDKAVKVGLVHRNKAARHKSMLSEVALHG